jgi:glycogen synthase
VSYQVPGIFIIHNDKSGWWYTYPSEKYESQLGLSFPIYGKIKNGPNHQPGYDM